MSNQLIENIDRVHTTAMDRPEFDERKNNLSENYSLCKQRICAIIYSMSKTMKGEMLCQMNCLVQK